MTEFKYCSGNLTCPACSKLIEVSIPIPIVETAKINISKEVFCSNQYCEASLRLSGNFIKKKKDTEGSLKINSFFFNGEEKDQSTYWHTAN